MLCHLTLFFQFYETFFLSPFISLKWNLTVGGKFFLRTSSSNGIWKDEEDFLGHFFLLSSSWDQQLHLTLTRNKSWTVQSFFHYQSFIIAERQSYFALMREWKSFLPIFFPAASQCDRLRGESARDERFPTDRGHHGVEGWRGLRQRLHAHCEHCKQFINTN